MSHKSSQNAPVLTQWKLTQWELTQRVLTQRVLSQWELTQWELTQRVLSQWELTQWELTQRVLTQRVLTQRVFTQRVMTPTFTGIQDATNAVPNSFRLGFMPAQMSLGNWDMMVGGLVDVSMTVRTGGRMMFLKSGLWTLAHEMQKSNVNNNATDEAPIFFYSFEFEAKESLFDWMFMSDPDIPIDGGVSHADDLTYLFDLPCCYEERCETMMTRLTLLYTNFAKYGDPTPAAEQNTPGQWSEFMPKWTHFSVDNPYLAVLSDNITLQTDFPLRWNYNQYGYNKSSSVNSQQKNQETMLQSSEQTTTTETTSSYSVATAVLSVVAACALVALCATIVWHKRQMRRQRDTLLANHNIAMDHCDAE
ncbi:Carboxylesterase type B [Trinorchestia longiramus]|nr:Carboxylesterase type B [Trinorchestia longiramus]